MSRWNVTGLALVLDSCRVPLQVWSWCAMGLLMLLLWDVVRQGDTSRNQLPSQVPYANNASVIGDVPACS